MFDGLPSYLVAAKHGTKYFHGLGPLKTLIGTYYPISLFYFCNLIQSPKRKRNDYRLFYAHFLILVGLALLSLSRGTLLTQFVAMGLVWHYSRSRFSITFAAVGLASLMLIASVHGVVRETVKFEDGVFSLGLQQEEGGEARFYKKRMDACWYVAFNDGG